MCLTVAANSIVQSIKKAERGALRHPISHLYVDWLMFFLLHIVFFIVIILFSVRI